MTPGGRSAILGSARKLMAMYGYQQTSVRLIAEHVGVSVPALYHHVESKYEILAVLLDASAATLEARVESALATASPDPDGQLAAVVTAIGRFMTGCRELELLDVDNRHLTDTDRALYLARRRGVEDLLCGIIGRGCAEDDFTCGNTRIAARAILAMCRGMAVGGSVSAAAAERMVRTYTHIALASLGSRWLRGTSPLPAGRA